MRPLHLMVSCLAMVSVLPAHTLPAQSKTSSAKPAPVKAAAPVQEFEGVISFRLIRRTPNGAAPPLDVQYYTKQGDVRVEIGAGSPNSMAGIVLPREKKAYRLISSQSLYMEQDLPDIKPQDNGPAPTVQRTGRNETVAGYSCEHIIVSTASDTTDACIAKGLGTFSVAAQLVGAVGNRLEAWQRTLLSDGAFPLKVTQRGETMMEVTKVEKKYVPGSLFIVPDNYSRAPSAGRRPPG